LKLKLLKSFFTRKKLPSLTAWLEAVRHILLNKKRSGEALKGYFGVF